MDDNSWLIELESALLDDCSVNDIYAICHGKTIPESLRPDVWQICLDVRHKPDQMVLFNEIYDLPYQNQLRADCNRIVEKLGNDDEDKVSVVSDLESVLTFYCKNRKLQYENGNGWIELLLPLLSLKLSRSYTYNLFEAIRETYIPKGCFKKGNVFHVFRLLILYHDPELCSMLDTKKITPDQYSMAWFQSLFAATCSFSVVLSMWDLYFQQTDPFLVFFLSLIMLINGRDQILAMKNESKDVIIIFLENMPCALEADDVVDFCTLAQYYSRRTPSSFKTDYLKSLFGTRISSSSTNEFNVDNKTDEQKYNSASDQDCIVSQALCLPASVYELVENAAMEIAHPDAVRFFLVDCRPAEQYNVGHLSTAFHLDSNLMLQEPIAFATAIQGLLRAQQQAIAINSNAGGEHLCFMGSGRLDEDQYTHMVVASFLQKNTQYVSLLTGGYTSIHEYFGEHMADCLEDHDPIKCLVCNKNNLNQITVNNNIYLHTDQNINKLPNAMVTTAHEQQHQRQSTDLFSKLSTAMKVKSAEVKGKLLDYIVNPNSFQQQQQNNGSGGNQMEKHVSSNEKNGKRYRNMAPVFSIDEENEDTPPLTNNNDVQFSKFSFSGDGVSTDSRNNQKEIVNLQQFLRQPEVITSFKCQEVHMNGYMYDSYLIVTNSHLIVLRDLSDDRKIKNTSQAQVIVRRSLSSIVKITAKRRHRDLITFKYGIPEGETLTITDMDRFLIPNASDATSLVSKHIVKQLETTGRLA